MFKKVLKCLFVLVLLGGIGFAVVWSMMREIPVLNRTVSQGEIITAEDIESKYHFNPGEELVIAERDLIGKTVLGQIDAYQPIAKLLIVAPDTTPADTESDKYVLVPLTLTDGQFPLDLEEGDSVYVSTFYSSGAVAQEPSFNIVYPTIGIVNELRTTSPTEGTVITTKGIDVLIEKEYAADVLFGTIAGQTYLMKTTDVDAAMMEGNSADREFRHYYNLPVGEFIDEVND